MTLGDITTTLIDVHFGDLVDAEIVSVLCELSTIRNLVDHHASVLAAAVERRGIAKKRGQRPVEMLIGCGAAPTVASRWVRVGQGVATLPMIGGHTELGGISSEHADAVIKGFHHIETRVGEPLDGDARNTMMTALLAQAVSGATPAEISEFARARGNGLVADDAAADADEDADAGENAEGVVPRVPASEDRRINAFTITREPDGRSTVRGDLDVVIAEKLLTTITAFAQPRPEPDGSRDARTPGQIRADGLEAALDALARADTTLIGAPTTHVSLMYPVDAPDNARFAFLGSVTERTAKLLSCDSVVTEFTVNGETVPVTVSDEHRLFTGKLRKALVLRDGGCIKCGAHASRTHGHHIKHWMDGGKTSLDNGCLLCSSCHAAVHNDGWGIVMGHDRHPWLIPPVSVDPARQPLRSYHRRTMHLDDVAS